MGIKVKVGTRSHERRPRIVESQSRPRAAIRRSPGTPLVLSPAPVLSILVPTVPGREQKLARLLGQLDPQVSGRSDTELLVLRDSRGMSIGHKRNKLVEIARGAFVAFVDDDDGVAPDYVSAIVEVLCRESPDVLCFHVMVHGYGEPKVCRYDPEFIDQTLSSEYRRKPNHIMVWRRALAAHVPFPDLSRGEDTAWAQAISPLAESVAHIRRVLYTYQYDPSDNSGTG